MHKQRLKFLDHLRFIQLAEAEPALVPRMELRDYTATVERIAVIDVAAFDGNCPQHITQRFTLEQVEAASRALHERIAQLKENLRAANAPDLR